MSIAEEQIKDYETNLSQYYAEYIESERRGDFKVKDPTTMDNEELVDTILQLYVQSCNLLYSNNVHKVVAILKTELFNRLEKFNTLKIVENIQKVFLDKIRYFENEQDSDNREYNEDQLSREMLVRGLYNSVNEILDSLKVGG